MRRALAAVGVGAMALLGTLIGGCGTPEPSAQTVGAPTTSRPTLATFEATVDVEHQTMTFESRDPSGTNAIGSVSVPIPYAISGNAGAYLHTRIANWVKGDGGVIPNAMSVGISAENLYNLPITNFTAYVDTISSSAVGLCNVNTTGVNACAKGGMTSTWTCTGGGNGTPGSPGLPPCHLDYGTVAHTGPAGPAGAVDAGPAPGDPGKPLPWWFAEIGNGSTSFHITGHIEGDAVPAN